MGSKHQLALLGKGGQHWVWMTVPGSSSNSGRYPGLSLWFLDTMLSIGILTSHVIRNLLCPTFMKSWCSCLGQQGVKTDLSNLVSLSWQKKKNRWREKELEKQKLNVSRTVTDLHSSLETCHEASKKQNYWHSYSGTTSWPFLAEGVFLVNCS